MLMATIRDLEGNIIEVSSLDNSALAARVAALEAAPAGSGMTYISEGFSAAILMQDDAFLDGQFQGVSGVWAETDDPAWRWVSLEAILQTGPDFTPGTGPLRFNSALIVQSLEGFGAWTPQFRTFPWTGCISASNTWISGVLSGDTTFRADGVEVVPAINDIFRVQIIGLVTND